jgi:uncharacterized SAM-binding protein YcdF (DUF218 family)
MSFIDLIFYPTKFIAQLILPPTGPLLLALLALASLTRWPKTARAALWLSVVSLLLLSTPLIATGLVVLLDAPPLSARAGKEAQAILVLGGGLIRATPEYGDTPSHASLTRARYGAKLAKQFNLPVIVSGGTVYGGRAEADVIAEMLRTEFGVTPRWVEGKSRHTAENARFSAEMLKQDHIRKVILVTDELHMRRSLAHCEASGLICYPAPVTYSTRQRDSWIEQLPSAGALQTSSYALHELLGNMALRWR